MVYAVKNMLMDQLTTHLQQMLITNVDDETRANVVREGKLQQDPSPTSGINVLIYSETEEDPDVIAEKGEMRGIVSPVHEVGGGTFYYYRFRIKFDMHFIGQSGDDGRSESRRRAYIVVARTKHAIRTLQMPTHPDTGSLADDFGEMAILVSVDEHDIRPSGGQNRFIWRGWMDFGFLIENLAT